MKAWPSLADKQIAKRRKAEGGKRYSRAAVGGIKERNLKKAGLGGSSNKSNLIIDLITTIQLELSLVILNNYYLAYLLPKGYFPCKERKS